MQEAALREAKLEKNESMSVGLRGRLQCKAALSSGEFARRFGRWEVRLDVWKLRLVEGKQLSLHPIIRTRCRSFLAPFLPHATILAIFLRIFCSLEDSVEACELRGGAVC